MKIKLVKATIAISSVLPLLLSAGCGGSNIPSGSDASKLPVNTTPASQLQAEAAHHASVKDYLHNRAAYSRRGAAK